MNLASQIQCLFASFDVFGLFLLKLNQSKYYFLNISCFEMKAAPDGPKMIFDMKPQLLTLFQARSGMTLSCRDGSI